MKRVLKIGFSTLAVLLILSFSIIGCFAKGALSLDSDVSVGVGVNDTVTYTFYLADCEKPVTDMVAYLFYDSEYLELNKDSVTFHDLMGVARNLDLDNYIIFNFSAIGSPVDFSEKKAVVSADFKVLKEGESPIQYFIGDLDCGDATESSSVKKFTFTCDYVIHSAEGDELIENVTPRLLDDEGKLNEFQGTFINYADGKGEQAESDENHIAVTGANNGGVIDVSKGYSKGNNTTIIITVAVIVIVLVVIILVVLRRIFGSGEDKEDEGENGDKQEKSENEPTE